MCPTEEMMSFLIAPIQKGTRAKAPRWKARSVAWMRPRFRCASSLGVVVGSDTIKSFTHAKSTRESKHLFIPRSTQTYRTSHSRCNPIFVDLGKNWLAVLKLIEGP